MPTINYGSFKQEVDDKGRWLINFSAALAAMKRGEKVARAHWGGYWFIPKNAHVEEAKPGEWKNFHSMNPMIVACLKDDGGYAPAQAYQEDLLAEDWVVIGREEETYPVSNEEKAEHLAELAEQSMFFGGISAGTITANQITGIHTIPAESLGEPPEENVSSEVDTLTPSHNESIYMLTEALRALDLDRDQEARELITNKMLQVLGLK